MAFNPNTFPVAETPDNLVTYAVGNLVKPPPGTTYLFEAGRVAAVALGKPGGVMLITLEKPNAET